MTRNRKQVHTELLRKAGCDKCKKKVPEGVASHWEVSIVLTLGTGEKGWWWGEPQQCFQRRFRESRHEITCPWVWSRRGAVVCLLPCCMRDWLSAPPGSAPHSSCALRQDSYWLWIYIYKYIDIYILFLKCSYYDKLTSGQNSNIYHYRKNYKYRYMRRKK